MPPRPRRPCRYSPYCNQPVVNRGLCLEHGRVENREHSPNAAFYSSPEWKRLRSLVLRLEPLCRICRKPATDVDHIIPIEDGGPALDINNCQPLCHADHSRKTWSENRARMGGG